MPPKMYRIRWEGVGLDRLHLYVDADPRTHKDCRQTVANASIPEADWRPVTSHPTADPWTQYDQQHAWAESGYGFIRNVRLEVEKHPGQWKQVNARDERG